MKQSVDAMRARSAMRGISIALLAMIACGGRDAKGTKTSTLAATPANIGVVEETGANLVAFASPQGIERLARSRHKVDFFTLTNHYEGQQNLGMCGPTSAVIVLNSLRAHAASDTKPTDPRLFPAEFAANLPPGLEPVFHRYSQGIFFDDERVSTVKSKNTFSGQPDEKGIRDPGLQLRQLHLMLGNHGLHSELRVANDDLSIEQIRTELRDNLGSPNDYIVINYQRKVLGQSGGGHISPLGAYDESSDSFLILDVNPNGKTWVWVKTAALVESMRTMDTIENRGYLLLSDPR